VLERAPTNHSLPKRAPCSVSSHRMRVRLVRKFANALNGLDLTKVSVGDVIDVAPHYAAMLILEGWAAEVANSSGKLAELRSFESETANDD